MSNGSDFFDRAARAASQHILLRRYLRLLYGPEPFVPPPEEIKKPEKPIRRKMTMEDSLPPPGDDCATIGMGGGCGVECSVYIRGECTISDEIDEEVKKRSNK